MNASLLINASYFIATVLFILGLKRMSSPVTARAGIVWAGVGMLIATLVIFLTPGISMLAGFTGYEVISKVPPLLHTPLMSGTNAISGISLVGAVIAAGRGEQRLTTVLGVVAIVCGTINVVGGYLVTNRMLRMFRKKK